ncbi:hypothetical protein NE236_28165 [Actinoallomurus purpureus]|uniref:hypothetical protein n=1 Tax=Actinoallomurus purpureus TaxID=478114 RepID=UPI002093C815|nr:hypothetical protein [Actinoallomurus purpureus]MCO6008857.1 hypothetical protein [Actinoallomurus purpureus]
MKIPSARIRTGAVLATASAAVLAVGGCGGGGGAAHDSATGSKTPSASAAPAILKGSALKGLLLPAGAMPKGFRVSEDGTRDSGEAVASRSDAPVPAKKVCGALGQTSWIRVTGIGGATFAQNDYANAAHTEEIAQEIDTYHGDDARQVIAKLRKVFAHCAAFTDNADGGVAKVKVKSATLPGAGDEGVKAVQTSSTWEGGTTLAAVRVGNAIVTTLYSSSHADKGAKAVAMTERVAKKVKAAG